MTAEKPTIVVLGSAPRCGSTLLCRSLGLHSQLENAEEAFHPRWLQIPRVRELRKEVYGRIPVENSHVDLPLHHEYVERLRREFHIFKLFPQHLKTGSPIFQALCDDAIKIFLYREDRQAQLASWRRACETGRWVETEKTKAGQPIQFPADANRQIEAGFDQYQPLADICLSYEQLISDWDKVIEQLQRDIGIEPEALPQAIKKQSRGKSPRATNEKSSSASPALAGTAAKVQQEPRIIVGVLTGTAYENRRRAVRSTWGRDASEHPVMDLVFLVGDPDAKMPRRDGDMLYLPCPDDYDSLPQKTRWFCLWALAHGGAWQWLFKCDDDTYVCVNRLAAGKWSKPIVGCKDGRGDHFHGGAGYLISREAAQSIAARLTARRGLEDWKARDAVAAGGMWFEHDDRFCFNTKLIPKASNEQITCHYCSPVRLRLVHDGFQSAPAENETTIPRVIHQIWLGGQPLPKRLAENRDSWAKSHPDWELKLWTDESLPKLTNQQAFESVETPAQKSHVARYEILYQNGGVYVDLDVECRRPIDDLLHDVQGFAGAEDDQTVGVAVLAATPGDVLLRWVIDALPESLVPGVDPPRQTGSWFFTAHLLADTTWRLLWWDAFYPRHWSGRVSGRIDRAYAVHQWEASWKP